MTRLPDEWQNAFIYEGWILAIGEPTVRNGVYSYRLVVGFSAEERIDVMAFRRAPTKNLRRGAACRVKGNFRFIPDQSGRVQLTLDAAEVTAIEAPGPRRQATDR